MPVTTQGATRYVVSPSAARRAAFDVHHQVPPAKPGNGLPFEAPPEPYNFAPKPRPAFGRAVARIDAALAEAGEAGTLFRLAPTGRVVNLATLALLLYELYNVYDVVSVQIPANPNPDYTAMVTYGWDVDVNWPPPVGPGDRPAFIYRYLRDPLGTSGTTNPDDMITPSGAALPPYDWSSVGVGHQVVPQLEVDDTAFGGDPQVYREQGYAYRTAFSVNPFTAIDVNIVYLNHINPQIDPNLLRYAPTETPQLVQEPELIPELKTWEFADPNGPARIYNDVSPRAPPQPREKDKKTISKSAAFAAKVFKALDDVSELSEIVSVFYDALPKQVRKDYEKELGFHWVHTKKGKWVWAKPQNLRRTFLDNAGQYGVDGADWKMTAIWRFWDKVDTDKAFRGLINNQTQDFVYGQIYKNTPKQLGKAGDDGFKQLNDWLTQFVYV